MDFFAFDNEDDLMAFLAALTGEPQLTPEQEKLCEVLDMMYPVTMHGCSKPECLHCKGKAPAPVYSILN